MRLQSRAKFQNARVQLENAINNIVALKCDLAYESVEREALQITQDHLQAGADQMSAVVFGVHMRDGQPLNALKLGREIAREEADNGKS